MTSHTHHTCTHITIFTVTSNIFSLGIISERSFIRKSIASPSSLNQGHYKEPDPETVFVHFNPNLHHLSWEVLLAENSGALEGKGWEFVCFCFASSLL